MDGATKKSSFKRKLKRAAIVIGLLIAVFFGYVELMNMNSKNLTYRQKVLKAVYPGLMWFSKITGKKAKTMQSEQNIVSPVSIYGNNVTLNSGDSLSLETLKGKKILFVNTASNCGYTAQYDDLQKLSELYKDKLVVIGFPSNEFGEQEKGSNEQIAEFCRVNYGVTFPLAQKSGVLHGDKQNDIYKWLSHKELNGWNDQDPTWNFSKYLLDENGVLVKYFDPGVSPLSADITEAIQK